MTQHNFHDVGHAQCLARGVRQGQRRRLECGGVEIARCRWIGGVRTRGKDPHQKRSERIEQTYEDECENDVEHHVELGGHLCHIGLEAPKGIGKWMEKRCDEGDARDSVEQIPDWKPIARRIATPGALEQRIDGGPKIGSKNQCEAQRMA